MLAPQQTITALQPLFINSRFSPFQRRWRLPTNSPISIRLMCSILNTQPFRLYDVLQTGGGVGISRVGIRVGQKFEEILVADEL